MLFIFIPYTVTFLPCIPRALATTNCIAPSFNAAPFTVNSFTSQSPNPVIFPFLSLVSWSLCMHSWNVYSSISVKSVSSEKYMLDVLYW